MAMTQPALLFMGALATLATIGLFQNFGDNATRAVVGFAGSILWMATGLAAFDVIIINTYAATRSDPIMPLVFVGFGFGAVIALFSLRILVEALRSNTSVSESEITP